MSAVSTLETQAPTADAVPLKIEGELSIRTAAGIRDRLAAHFDQAGDIVLDLAGVRECDVTAVQLLSSLRKTAAQKGRTVRIQAISQAVQQSLAALGFRLEEFLFPGADAVQQGGGRGL